MDRTICANESSRGRGFSASLRSTVFGSVDRPGGVRGIRLPGQPPRGRWFLRFVEEPDVFLFHKNSLAGVSPEPPTASPRHVHGHGNVPGLGTCPKRVPSPGTGSPVRSWAGATRATDSRSAVESDASTRFGAAILHREDVEFLGRKPETGGTPTPPRVEFVRYSRSHGLGFRQTGRQTPRMALGAVFPRFGGPHGSDSCPVGQGTTQRQILKPWPVTAGGP